MSSQVLTDGAVNGNPGLRGWAFLLVRRGAPELRRQPSGSLNTTTWCIRFSTCRFCPHVSRAAVWHVCRDLRTVHSRGCTSTLRAAADHRETERDVLRVPGCASRRAPPDGVRTSTQRPHEQVVPLFGAWTEEQLGDRVFISDEITGGQLHVEEGRRTP
jgi:hypothetical protein